MRTAFPYQSAFLAVAAFLALMVVPVHAETPTEAVDRLWGAFAKLDPNRGPNFPTSYWKLSRQVAQEQGLAVIPVVMDRSKDWKKDEDMIFLMLMVSLPKDQAVPILEKYQIAGKSWERHAAAEFLAEISEYPKELDAMTPEARKKFLEDTTP